MTADVESLVLEQPSAIRAPLSDHGDRLAHIEMSLSSTGQHIGALMTAVYGGKSELDGLRRRLERVERRLELSDN